MKAVFKENTKVSIQNIPDPAIADTEVLVKVHTACCCRTDSFAAQGKISTADRIVLGHEFSGTVVETGRDVKNLPQK